MVRAIVKNPVFLAQPSEPATSADAGVVADLMDTLRANAERCVGLAANMIGVRKRILVFSAGILPVAMLNPTVIARSEPYEAEEGCLSLPGTRKAKRYCSIKVQYQNEQFQTRLKTFTGWTAQIIQHEIDHCNGVLI